MAIFWTVLPRAVFRTQLKVYGGGAQIVNFQLLTFLAKRPIINVQLCFENNSVACKEKRKKIILYDFALFYKMN